MFNKFFSVFSLFLALSWCFASPLLAADEAMPEANPGAVEEKHSQPAAEVPAAPPTAEEPAKAPSAETAAPAEEAAPAMSVEKMVVCIDVIDRMPIGEGTLFQDNVGKLYCHSLVLGAEEETIIHHVWYWNDQKMADVPLTVRSQRYRTYSSKNIVPGWKGSWRVELTGPDGEVLSTAAFNVE